LTGSGSFISAGIVSCRLLNLRREPYRLFFPLGLLLGWAGVLHWLLHGAGWLANYRPVFHAIAQVQGFLMCFAVGFLFTAIPRRTETEGPSGGQIALVALCAVGTTACSWFQWWGASQLCWLILVGTLIGFALGRVRRASGGRKPPNSFVWIPLSLLTGVAGSVLIGAYGFLGDAYYGLHELGRLLLLQAMFLGLVLGAGGMVLPLISYGRSAGDGSASRSDRLERGAHLLAALLLAGTFWWEWRGHLQGAYVARALILTAVLAFGAQLWRRPTVEGWHRRWVWLSAWMLPLGYLIGALFPLQKKAGLHVVFIGGLATMAFGVGVHVTLAHGGYKQLVRGRPWQVPCYGALFMTAMLARGLMEFDQERYFVWMTLAAGAFVAATLFWAALALPRMRG
jgi:uncharacterized protein involved in response to NO